MSLYFLTYDLRKQKDYEKLYKELKNFNAVRILQSTWCFTRFNTTCTDLTNYFRPFIDSDDGLIVSDVTSWAAYNTLGTPNDLS